MKKMKDYNQWIGFLSGSLLIIIAIVFVTMISSAKIAKDTYATCVYSCASYGSGYTLTAANKCLKTSTDSVTCYQNATVGDGCATYRSQGYTCTVVHATSQGASYSCSKQTQDIKDAICNWQASCYTYNGKYIWATSQSQAVGNANGLSQSQCTGCASGYKAQGSTCVVDCGSHASYTDAGCVCDVGYYKSGGSCVKGAGYCDSGVPGDCDGKVGNPDWDCQEFGMGPAGMVYSCTYVGSQQVTATVTLIPNSGPTQQKTCIINAGEQSCRITVAGTWGAKDCTSGTSTFVMTRSKLTATYYECCCEDCGTVTPAKTTTKAPTGAGTPTKAPTGAGTPTKTPTKAPTGAGTPTKTPTKAPTGAGTPTKTPTSGSNKCYLVNHKYIWASSKPAGGVLVSSITSSSKCTGCESGYEMTDMGVCENPGTPENPPTGATGIVFVWLIGLCAIGYSFWYFKKTGTN